MFSKQTEDSAEARVFEAYWRGDFHEVVKQCEAWRVEEPYSSRPNQFGSGAAITIEEFSEALRFCDEGLKINPDQAILKNNRAYSLVATGRHAEAAPLIASGLEAADSNIRAVAKATSGFLLMRAGNCEQGAKQYRDAIDYLKRSNIVSESLAWAYFAQEAARAELPEAAQIVADARNACKRLEHFPEAHVLLGRAERWMKAVTHRKGRMSLVDGS